MLYAEPDQVIELDGVPSDPEFVRQWSLHNLGLGRPGGADADIDAPEAWAITHGSADVVVGVIDSGVDYTHPDLAANMFQNTADCNSNGVDDDGNGYVDDCYGIDPADNDSNPMDLIGHGTHVAGIIGAVGNNGVGIAGVNWQVKIAACRIFGEAFTDFLSDAIICFEYFKELRDRGVNVVATNNSWGGGFTSLAFNDVVRTHLEAGILLIASAGNSSLDMDDLQRIPTTVPLPNVVVVAATEAYDRLAWFSNRGRGSVHLGAPGDRILSTVPSNGYMTKSGTSMAAPHVAGVAALLKAADPTRDWRAIRNLLLTGGDIIPATEKTISGQRLNAFGSLTCSDSVLLRHVQPRGSPAIRVVGETVILQALHVNCASPNGAVSVTISPGEEVIELLDDGQGLDEAAGDGLYSGQWQPPAVGIYTLAFSPEDAVDVVVVPVYNPLAEHDAAQYREIGAGQRLGLLNDNESVPLQTPFPIRFGGYGFNELQVSANGGVSLTGSVAPLSPSFLPHPGLSNFFAAWWNDLYPEGKVYWGVVGTAPNREFVVEWRDVTSWQCGVVRARPDLTVTFQIVFSESSDTIRYNYKDVVFDVLCQQENGGGRASVGIQTNNFAGVTYSFLAPSLSDGMSIRIEPGIPELQLSVVRPTSVVAGEAVTLDLHGRNFQPGVVAMWGLSPLTTTYLGSTLLRAQLEPTHTPSPGDVDVTIYKAGVGYSNVVTVPVFESNPVPVITSTEITLPAGTGPDFLFISGTGFIWGSVARWNGEDRPTVVSNSTFLRVSLSEADLLLPGTATLAIVNPGPGGGSSNIVSVDVIVDAPFVYEVKPAILPRGAPGATIRVSASNAYPGSTVLWNGSPRTTRFLWAATLEADLTAADLATIGAFPVGVSNGAAGTSSGVLVDVGEPPVNDLFANAIAVTSLPFSDSRTVRYSSASSTDPYTSCIFPAERTVWYRLTLSESRRVVLYDVGNELWWTAVAIFRENAGSFQEVFCDFFLSPALGGELPTGPPTFVAEAGVTYAIMVMHSESGTDEQLALQFVDGATVRLKPPRFTPMGREPAEPTSGTDPADQPALPSSSARILRCRARGRTR